MVRALIAAGRVTVVAGVYLATATAGAAIGAAGEPGGQPLFAYLAAALLGGAVLPFALTLGWLLWLVPAVLRAAFARDRDPALVPEWFDAPLLVVPTLAVAVACSTIVPDVELGRLAVCACYAALAFASVGAILFTGGRHVAQLWLRLVT